MYTGYCRLAKECVGTYSMLGLIKTKLKVNYLISGEFHVIKCVISIVFLSNDKIFVTIVSFNICNTLEQPIQKSSTESGYTVNMVVN